MPPKTNYSGRRVGLLVYQRDTGEKSTTGHSLWWAKCDCGGETVVPTNVIARQRSCGCLGHRPKSNDHRFPPNGDAQ